MDSTELQKIFGGRISQVIVCTLTKVFSTFILLACNNNLTRNNLNFWSECIEPLKATSRPPKPKAVVFKVV